MDTIPKTPATVAICPSCKSDMYIEYFDYGRVRAVQCSGIHCNMRGPASEVGAPNALRLWRMLFPA